MKYTALLLFSLGLVGCGPGQVHLDPRNVTAVTLKMPTAQPTFCPGNPIRVDLRASLKDGSVCSSADASATCMGEKGVLIDASQIRLEGTAGVPGRAGEELFWVPPRDALVTAERGLSLRGWIESGGQKGALLKSPLGQIELRPQYECLQENVFTLPPPEIPGQSGVAGPDLKVTATLIATPFYAEAMLVRVEAKVGKTYILATDRTKSVTIFSKGQNGAAGLQGRSGSNGADGAPASGRFCEAGRPGMSGIDGTFGGHGGDGGPGGVVQLFIDEAVGDKLQGWLKVGSVGGDGGRGGTGGAGGTGGRGGPHSEMLDCKAPDGAPGKNGTRGPDGDPGRPGLNGPGVKVAVAPQQALFADELPAIQRLKGGAAAR